MPNSDIKPYNIYTFLNVGIVDIKFQIKYLLFYLRVTVERWLRMDMHIFTL